MLVDVIVIVWKCLLHEPISYFVFLNVSQLLSAPEKATTIQLSFELIGPEDEELVLLLLLEDLRLELFDLLLFPPLFEPPLFA